MKERMTLRRSCNERVLEIFIVYLYNGFYTADLIVNLLLCGIIVDIHV